MRFRVELNVRRKRGSEEREGLCIYGVSREAKGQVLVVLSLVHMIQYLGS